MTIPVAVIGTLYHVAIERACVDPQCPRKVWLALSMYRW